VAVGFHVAEAEDAGAFFSVEVGHQAHLRFEVPGF
jgi:hypothetical protein